MAATIKMVAERAGVSVATVSKYINGGNVYEENRVRVQKAIDDLDYKINEVARSLKTNKTYTVGILASSIQSIFIAGIISSIQHYLLEHGYSTIIADYQEDEKQERKQLEVLMQKHVDGLIIFPEENEEDVIRYIQNQGIPVLIVDNLVENAPCDAILTDNVSGIYEAVERLIQLNHRRIGIITGPQTMYTARERLKGYERAHEDYHIEKYPELIQTCQYDIDGGYQSMKALLDLKDPPTAVVMGNYYTSIGTLKAINERKLRIPYDISVVSFDYLEFSCILETEITCICQQCDEIGKKAASKIVKRIKGDQKNFPQIIRVKPEVRYTESIQKI